MPAALVLLESGLFTALVVSVLQDRTGVLRSRQQLNLPWASEVLGAEHHKPQVSRVAHLFIVQAAAQGGHFSLLPPLSVGREASPPTAQQHPPLAPPAPPAEPAEQRSRLLIPLCLAAPAHPAAAAARAALVAMLA